MIKFTSNNDFDFAIDSVRLIKDNSQLVKRASAKSLLKYEKTPNQEDLHVIAVGAYEGTGCFFHGAPVQTINGQQPIDEITVGTQVLTHKGRYRPVIAVFKEEYQGEQVSLDVTSMCDPIMATGNHPFSVLPADKFKSKDRCPSLLDDNVNPKDLLDDILEKDLKFTPARDIQPGDYVVTPINISLEDNQPQQYTDDEAYLFGYYLSEGCLVKEYKDIVTKGEYKQLMFTLNNQGDQPIIEFLEGFITGKGRCCTPLKSYTSDVGLRISFGHKEYATTVLNLFGCYSTNKRIGPEVFVQPLDWKLKFLAAYFDGDGSLCGDDTNGEYRYIGTLTASTASRNLAYDLQRLLASCGITCSIYQGVNKVSNGCFGNADHTIYQVAVGASHSNKILQFCKRLKSTAKHIGYTTGRSWVSHNYLVLKVKGVKISDVNTVKYNLEVEEDNTYVVDIQGHNSNRNGDAFLEEDCRKNHHFFRKADRAVHRHHKNKPSDPKFGNIKAAAYNEEMRRVELIVGLDRDKCADILHEQETEGNTNWSMASRQSHDICSFCKHKARNDKERCEHIPKQLGEINKKGEMCFMINPDPRWFEISYVKRPADRIGLSLGKMASANGVSPLPATDYLTLYKDLYVPDDFLVNKNASDKRALLTKLAAIEKRIEALATKQPTTKPDVALKDRAVKLNASDDLPASVIDELRKHEPSRVLKMLADNGIVFSPADFVKYIFGDRVSSKRVDGIKSLLPDIFSKSVDNDEGLIDNDKYEPGSSGVDSLKGIVKRLIEGFSLKGDDSVGRVMRITIIGRTPKPLSKSVNDNEKTKESFDKEAAKQYAAYKLAALNHLDQLNQLDEDLMFNAVAQNRK